MLKYLAPAILCSATILPAALAQTIQINKENRTIAITATDEASAPADLAAVTIGFEIFGADQNQTYADSTRISNTIMDALRAIGIPPAQIESREQNMTSIGDDNKLRFAKGIRFRFAQSWQVTVSAASAADTIHAGILAGGNQSGNIQWKLKSEDALEAEASTKALEHARQIADRMARGLNSKLGPLVYASNQVPQRGPFAGMLMQTESAMVARAKTNLKPLAISPEKIEKTASVYAVFAIE